MIGRIIPILLLLWVVVGLVIWIANSDETTDVAVLDSTPADEDAHRPEADPLAAPRTDAPTHAELARTAPRESAAALMTRLGRAMTAEQRAEITAWLRAHPDRGRELMAAFAASSMSYTTENYRRFLRDVFGPLHDLESLLSPALLDSLADPVPSKGLYYEPPALGVLSALSPLSAATRRDLEDRVRARPESRWNYFLTRLVLANAESGAEVLSFVQWLLSAETFRSMAGHARGVMRLVTEMGTRGAGLTEEIARHVMAERIGSRDSVRALIAIAPDDPLAHRALVGRLASGGPGLGAAHRHLLGREDAKQILLGALEDESPRVRMGAISALLQKDWGTRERMLAALLANLVSEELLWRDKAMRMIPTMTERAEEVVPTLEAMFRSHDEWQWVTAAKTLHLLASASRGKKFDVSDALRDALHHDNVLVRRVIAQGLMNYGPDAAVPMLRVALDDEDSNVRERAADGLGELARRDAGALAALEEAATHPDPQVSEMARAWLEEIEDVAASEDR